MNRRDTLKAMLGATAVVTTAGTFGRGTAFAQAKPTFTLPPLGYDYNALEPHIDTATMGFHHKNHHNAFIGNLNGLVEKYPDLATKPIDQILSGLADVPEAEKAERLPHQASRPCVLLLVPFARTQIGHVICDPPIDRQDQRHRQLGHRNGVLTRAIRYVDAPLGGARNVDGIDAGAGADNQRQRAGVQHGQLLEVGCAYGYFLDEAARVFRVSGVEVAESAASAATVGCRAGAITARCLGAISVVLL